MITYNTDGVKMPSIKKRENTAWVKAVISGDLFISLDTVRTNAEQVGATYEEELHRVIIHGILHLCGINDKGPGEREIMEAAEDKALALRSSLGQ